MEPQQNQANQPESNQQPIPGQFQPQNGLAPPSPQVVPPSENKNKKIILVILVALAALIILAIGILLLIPSGSPDVELNSQPSSTNSQLGDDVQTRLDTIRIDLQGLGAVTDASASDIAADVFSETFDDGSVLTIPSDVYANFAEINGLDKLSEINTALEKNGLSDATTTTEDSTDDKKVLYRDGSIACVVFANESFARVNCVSRERFNLYKNDRNAVVSATEAVLGVTLRSSFVQFYENDDKTITGATVSGAVSETNSIETVYLVNENESWEFVAQATRGRQSEIPPACDEFTDQQIDLFKSTGLQCEDENSQQQDNNL